jgi:hypothetical protein
VSAEVRYLGLTFDKGLTWSAKLDKVMNRAYRPDEALLGRYGA